MVRKLLGACLLGGCGVLAAAEIAFTGGADGAGTDLAAAANWAGGVLPGAEDVGVVDYATFTGGGALTVGRDLGLGGLRIRNATASTALSLDGASTLSLGAAGLSVHTNAAMTIRVPIAVTAASTWQFSRGALALCSTFSGTAALTVQGANAISIYAALGYDGDILFDSWGLRFYTAGKMARSVKSIGAERDIRESFVSVNVGGEIRWSDVFTGGTFEYTTWRRLYVAATNNAPSCAHLVMDDPQDLFFQNGPYRSGIASGIFDQRDGFVKVVGPNYGFSVGSFEVGAATGAKRNDGRFPVEYRLSGGSNDTAYVFIGEDARFFTNNPVLKQSGGLSKVHKGIYLGAATDSSDVGFGEYQLSGGRLYVRDGTVAGESGSDHQTRGLVFCHPFGGLGQCPGVFTQTGGTNTTLTVKFGPDTQAWNAKPPQSINTGFGLFDLRGGVVTFTDPTSPFSFGAGWNAGATNATYRINVSGGTMNFKDGQRIAAQIEIPPAETESTWHAASGTVTVDAPVSGLGTLKKTGAGQLILNNMNRFGGTLKVAEGTVKMAAAPEDDSAFDDAGDTCWIWTADTFAATHTNNQDVASWSDGRHGVTALDWTYEGSVFHAEWLKDPTFTQDGQTGLLKGYPKHLPTFSTNDYFNGHGSVRFAGTLLQIPGADNPLAGATNWTVAVVYRENGEGSDSCWYGTPIFGGTEYWFSGMDTVILTMDASNRMGLNAVYMKDGTTRTIEKIASRAGRNLRQKACVAVCTMNGNAYALNVNGHYTNAVLSGSAVRPMFKYGDDNLPLNFGGHFPDIANFNSGNVYIAEIRAYRDRSFTEAQQNLLARKLMEKYVGAGGAEFDAELNARLPATMRGEAAPKAPKATDYEWTADAANALADGAEVTSLAAVGGGKAATTSEAGAERGPTLVKDAYNGHSALRFRSADKTALGIAAADVPVDRKDFAIAVVFATKTDAPAAAQAVFRKDSGTGIAVQDLGTGGGHLGFTFHREGTLLAGYNWSWFVNRRPFRLNDGMPHVAVFTRDAAGSYVYMVDGRAQSDTTPDCGANGTRRLLLGKLATGQDAGHFDGDILAVRLYHEKLTLDEARAVSEHYAYTYGFRLLPYLKTAENVADNGFGRVALDVGADGTLVLPYSQTAPFTVSEGRSLTGAGRVVGSVRFGQGGVLNAADDLPEIDDLQFADGMVIRVGPGAKLPLDGTAVATVSGKITLDATGFAASGDGPSRIEVLTGLGEGVVRDGTQFVVSGLGGNARAEVGNGTVAIVRSVGTLLTIR